MPDLLEVHLSALKRHPMFVAEICPDPCPIAATSFHLWSLFSAAVDSTRYEVAGRGGQNLTVMHEGRGGKSVARVQVRDLMLSYRPMFRGTATPDITNAVRAAAADPNVSGILLEVDSPGGMVSGVEDLASAIGDARRKKPVWASIENLGASAAYWAASQADAVYATNKTTFVGSIGTYLSFYDASKAAAAEGIEPVVFSTGPLKGAAATPGAPITEEQRAHFQGLVNETQVHFDAAVKNGRGLNQTQLNAVKSGAVYSAPRAVELRLIDGIRPLAKTLAELAGAK